MSTVAGSPPAGGDETRATAVMAVSWIFFAVSTLFIVVRMYVRTAYDKRIWWDDVAACFTASLVLAFTVLATVFANSGFARHTFYLDATDSGRAAQLNLAMQCVIFLALGAGKVSAAFVMKRLMPVDGKCQQWVLTGVVAGVSSVALMMFITLLARCQPASALSYPTTLGSCWDSTAFKGWNFFAYVFFAFADFFLAFFILPLLPDLPFSTGKKIGVVVSALIGFTACACAIAKTVYMPSLEGEDYTWSISENLIWNAVEVNLIIVAATLPALLPLGQSLKRALQSPARTGSEDRDRVFQSDKMIRYECNTSAPPMPLEMPCVLETVKAELPSNDKKSTGSVEDVDGPAIHQSVDVHIQYEDDDSGAMRTKSIL